MTNVDHRLNGPTSFRGPDKTSGSKMDSSKNGSSKAYAPRAKSFVLATLRKSFEEFYCLPLEAAQGLNIESAWRHISWYELYERIIQMFTHLQRLEREHVCEWSIIKAGVYQRAVSEAWPEKRYENAIDLARVQWLTAKLSAAEMASWHKRVEEMRAQRAYERHQLVKWLRCAWWRDGRTEEDWVRFLVWREVLIQCYREQLAFDLDTAEKRRWRRWLMRKVVLYHESECWAALWQHVSEPLVAYLKRRFRCETPAAYPKFQRWINTQLQINRLGFTPRNDFKREEWHSWVIAKLDLLVDPDMPAEWHKVSFKDAKHYYTRCSPTTTLRRLRKAEGRLKPQLQR